MKLSEVPNNAVVAERIDMSDETTREVRHVYRRKVRNEGKHVLTQIIGLNQREPRKPPRYRVRDPDGPLYTTPGALPVLTVNELRQKARKR